MKDFTIDLGGNQYAFIIHLFELTIYIFSLKPKIS